MRNLCIAAVLAIPAAAAHSQTPAPPAPSLTAAECAVWARETSFAQSVAAHDATAFAEHLHPHAVFGAKQPQPTRGRDAIARSWAGLIAGTRLKLLWYPAMVAVAELGGENDIAYSSGPALYEAVDPKAQPRYHLGGFQSVWHKGTDGTWRVLFDDGIEPRPATDAEVAAFHAGRKPCPQA
jgi:ketosteroid isomerase-like protein